MRCWTNRSDAAAVRWRRSAARDAAFFLATGVDLAAALAAPAAERAATALRVRRLLERERLRGARRHWSYDLNRHIALAETLPLLAAAGAAHRDVFP